MTTIPVTKIGQRFLLSPDGREAEWVNPANVPARCAGWTDETDLSLAELDIVSSLRMAAHPVSVT